jgi:uncharacterized DUF497 family protein
MVMTLFDWDEANVEHIAAHDVEPYEAEEVLDDLDRVSFDTHGKGVKGVIGKTEDGRIMVVIYILRNGGYRVITARNSTNSEKRIYRRRGQ